MQYAIEFSKAAEEHLDSFSARDRKTILSAIAVQLAFQPATETRNRKELRPNPLATWELRIGKFRAVKIRSQYTIEGKEYEL